MKVTPFGVAIVESDTHLSEWVMEHGRLDVQSLYCRMFIDHIPAGGVVADVGACIGDHTLSYSEMVGPTGRVHAFEPNPVAFECLEHNMRQLPQVWCYRMALGDVNGHADTFISNPPHNNLGAHRIEKSDSGLINVITLDWFAASWPRLDFIKIDAEGFEPEIIAGAMQTLQRLKPVILIEINRSILADRGKSPADITDPLKLLGYTITASEPHLSLELEMVDALCIPTR